MFSYNLWDYAVWSALIQISLLLVSILLGNILVRKVGILKKSLLPAPLIGGFILLVLQTIPAFAGLINRDFMIIITFHAVGIGSVAVLLKRADKSERKKEGSRVIKSSLVMVNVHLIQGLIGLAITILASITIMRHVFPATGLLGPVGLGQGSGLAVSMGLVMAELGFDNAVDFGLTVVAIGFFVACIGGVFIQSMYRKKGLLPAKDKDAMKEANKIELPTKDEIGLTDTADKFTIEVSIVFGLYFAGFLIMMGISHFILPRLSSDLASTIRPLIFGLNFVFGIIAASIFKKVMNHLRKKKIVEKEYINNFLMTRIAGVAFDIMIVAGLATIQISNLTGLWLILILICILSGIATFFYLRTMCQKIFPDYSEAILFGMYGKLTGTTGCGMLLLREVDPKLETPAAKMLALQSFPATILGAPLFLLIPLAAISLELTLIVFTVIAAMLIIFQIILVLTMKKSSSGTIDKYYQKIIKKHQLQAK